MSEIKKTSDNAENETNDVEEKSKDVLDEKLNKKLNGELEYKLKDNLIGKMENVINDVMVKDSNFNNEIKKKSLSHELHFDKIDKDSHILLKSNSEDVLELITKNEKNPQYTNYASSKLLLKDNDAPANINITSRTDTSTSKDTHNELETYGNFFNISEEAKHELSEHVKKLIKDNNEPDNYANEVKQNDYDSDESSNYKRKKRKKKKNGLRSKIKKNKLRTNNEINGNDSFKKLKTLYKGAQDATANYITKIFSSKVYIEKNIIKYDDILSKHSDNIINHFNIFEETKDEEEISTSDTIENGILDNICEYFAYLMALSLKS
ncbi:conserved Plasmodium protein, unknown function [Plasmodium yoelii]|uniref:Uncharacterized protein n=2 Tax=Plasmodium yoelii TaxID=5861 RepID=A0AAF0B1A6_PLAYO|nr:conserved Plasmodium protein, unknown function [Plasmodium yoelii]WBY58662.1 hypothetical protein Py17XNL_001105657 [Plasmodium yoelii yoelii]CDU18949.1 conserved Plasmodium protein, unknown function [Plasmodium yoelii]VTZ79534.1 conserved Plasmodium protein, unknown function [Plasmodium yoelii]|eukprot:XP_022812420.1 conserved Plasmodium protein, unknown function [Plasmodium yoelii]